jgi:hypothetical protein
MGVFDSGLDISGWGAQEWAIVGLSGLGLWAALSSTAKVGRKVKRAVRRRRSVAERRARLQEELAAL